MRDGSKLPSPGSVIVPDAAPLIYLAAGGALDLLQALGRVVVPDVVQLEATRLVDKPFARDVAAWFSRHAVEVAETEIGGLYRLAVEVGRRPPRHAGEVSIVQWLTDMLVESEQSALVVADEQRVARTIAAEKLPGAISVLTTRKLVELAEEKGLIASAGVLWSRIRERAPTANPLSTRMDLPKR